MSASTSPSMAKLPVIRQPEGPRSSFHFYLKLKGNNNRFGDYAHRHILLDLLK